MKSGEKIYANTHYEFINKLLNKHIDYFGKCALKMKNDDILWFIPINGKQHSSGWTNTPYDGGNAIREEYTAGLNITDEFELEMQRVVFNVIEATYSGREYVFMGVYELDYKHNFNSTHHTWRKISDTYDFSKCKY
jgi:hypothetical protein